MQQKAKLAAIVLSSLLAARSDAGNNYSIGLKFAADDTGVGGALLSPTDVAGVLPQANWNNLNGANGSSDNPNANSNSVAVTTSVHLEWTSAGSWASWGSRGENNGNTFQVGTPDRTLIGGYLDTGNATTTLVTITNLPADLTSGGYSVYVYALGGATATPPRGGSYRILAADGVTVLKPYLLVSSDPTPADYVRDAGADHTGTGSYMVFSGLTSPNIIVEATTTNAPNSGTPRAPINAIQLVAVHAPEPSAATALNVVSNASGQLRLSWTPGAGSSGSLVIMKEGTATSRQPLDGVAYTANAALGSGENLGASNYVVYAGTGTNVIVTGLAGGRTYSAAVYSLSGSGDNVNYALDNPTTGSGTGPAALQSITLQLPSPVQTNAIVASVVTATFDAGPSANVTAAATYSSGNTNIATVSAAGVVTFFAPVLGTNVTITAAYAGKTNSVTITFVDPPPTQLINRYSFAADANDSVGGKHGTLMNGAAIVGGQLELANPGAPSSADGTRNYVDLPNDLLTNLPGGVTFELWLTDNNSANWGRVFDIGQSSGGEGNAGGGTNYMFLAIPGNGTASSRAAFNPGSGEGNNVVNWTTGNGGRPAVGKKTHIVVTVDPQTRRGVIYADGVPVGTSTGFTVSPAQVGRTYNSWLGRSQYNDPYWDGSIDEFRIYSNALSAVQVAINSIAGPGTLGGDPGTLQSIALLAQASMSPGATYNGGVSATYANYSGVNVTAAGSTFSSDNTNIVTVSATGVITAVGAGTANVQASFGGKTDSKAITVAAPQVVLTHRYSFTANANDSVGTAHGTTLQGTPTYSGGVVTLDGSSSIALPPGLVTGYGSLSVEAWVYGPSFASGGPMYLFGFGTTNALGLPVNFARLAVHTGGGTPVTRSGLNGSVLVNGQATGEVPQEAGWGALIGPTNHIVAVFDGVLRQQRIYLNGDLLQTITQNILVSSISNTLSYIGQSLAANDAILFAGYLDEFRTYNGAMNLEQVRTSRAAGPDNPQLSAGAYTSVSLNVPAALIQTVRRLPGITGSSAGLANVDLSQVATVTSSDTNIVSVLANGRIQANNLGIATITATMGSASDSKSVQVVAKQTALMHRYSFKGNFNDSVGGASGTPRGSAVTDGSENLTLDGTRGAYLDLPKFLVDGYQAITIEAWATINASGNWTRLFDFGNYAANNNPGGNAYIFFAPRTAAANYRIAINQGGEQQATAGTASLDDGALHHIVCVFQTDPAVQRHAEVYLDGVNVITNTTFTRNFAAVSDDWNYIGRSLYAADSPMNAVIDEVRIYHGTLGAAQVSASFAAGPNGTPPVGTLVVPSLPPSLSFSRSGDNIVLSWTDPAAALVAAGTVDAAVNTYTNVPGATSPYTNSPSATQLYFRLKK